MVVIVVVTIGCIAITIILAGYLPQAENPNMPGEFPQSDDEIRTYVADLDGGTLADIILAGQAGMRADALLTGRDSLDRIEPLCGEDGKIPGNVLEITTQHIQQAFVKPPRKGERR